MAVQDSYYAKLLAVGLIIALTSLNCFGVKETTVVREEKRAWRGNQH